MKYYSTSNGDLRCSARDAVLLGLAPGGGLFMPETIPVLAPEAFSRGKTLQEIAFGVARIFFGDGADDEALREIVHDALDFEVPIRRLHGGIFALELFHGPTLAFKDVGARFMARLTAHYTKGEGRGLCVLVATSGDTGSAVASGFSGVDGVSVVILYPSGKVSELQEKQLTTAGDNVHALEVDGTFDDCQRMVKEAFSDAALRERLMLTSANSINVARFLPQSFYYFHAAAQLQDEGPVTFSVPSGNFGNLTAGLVAQRMGLPAAGFLAATNINDVVPQYLASRRFSPRPSVPTISNAMDVGDPSNFARMLDLFGGDHAALSARVKGYRFTDDETRQTMRELYGQCGYLTDPHGAIGYRALRMHLDRYGGTGIFLETAHPAKFRDTVEEATGVRVPLPERLQALAELPKRSTPVCRDYLHLKDVLLAINT